MPKYIVLEKSLVGNQIHEAGEEVEYDGLPSENLQPTCAEGEAKYQEYLETNAARIAKMRDQFGDEAAALGDPAKFGAAVAKAIADAQAEAAEKNAQVIAATVSQAVAEAFAIMFPNGANKAAVKDLV